MKKIYFGILSAISMILLFANVTLASEIVGSSIIPTTEIANPTSQKIFFNSEEVNCEVYNISDRNYFKLRDVAAIVNGTSAQFSIEYDGNIYIAKNNEYTFVGNELSKGNKETQVATRTTSAIFINGIEVFTDIYNINDNNYFGIRFLGNELGFDVKYDEKTDSVFLTASEPIKYDVKAINKNDSNSNKRSQFNLYKKKMNEAQEAIEGIYSKVKREEGRQKSKNQVYAYIALGNWMTEKDASNLKFVKLDSEEVKENYNIILPKIEGTTSDGENIKSEYYLTRDGIVFIYPPYSYNSNEYINAKIKMKEEKSSIGNVNITAFEITQSQTFKDIPIKDEEKEGNIKIITSFNTGFTLDKKQVLEFSFSKYSYPGVSLIVNDIDLRNDEIKVAVYYGDEKIMDVETLYPYCEANYSNISTGQLYINSAFFDKELTIKFFRNEQVFAEGKIKLVK